MFNISDTYFIAMIFVFGCVCAFFISWVVLKLILRIRQEQKDGDHIYPDVIRSFSAVRKVLAFVYSSEKSKAIVWIIVVVTSLHLLFCLFFLEAWNIWRDHGTLFWGTNLAVVAVAFLALADFRYGKGLAWTFGLLTFFGILTHVSKTPMWQEWKASENRPTPVSAPVAKAVELPRGILKCEPGPEIQAITGWPPVYELEIRNIDILDGTYINFDLWKEGIGKYGEYRWDKDVSPRNGRFTRCDKPVTGTWRLIEKLPPTARYSMILKGSHKADGAVHEEPMTLYVKVQ